jgi:lysozyme
MLGWDLRTAGDAVDKLVRVPLNEGERLAYTDFTFNVGVDAFAKSTALRKLNAGDRAGACAEMLRWNKGTVKGKLVVLPGLDRRRKAENLACVSGKVPS